MLIDSDDPVNEWWQSPSKEGAFPGKMALVVGAGVSYDAPTNLPLGIGLTHTLLHHLLDERAAREILGTFEAAAPVIGRKVPRLEHVFDVVCNRAIFEVVSEAKNPRELLRIFEGRHPNSLHRLIARHLGQTRGWVITTNFDDCIERAYLEMYDCPIPVHVQAADSEAIEILNRRTESDWGLVKLHGTIAHGVDRLGSTLSDLVPGLPSQFQELLKEIFESVDLIVVAGYSGTDYFDVNAWIRKRMNAKTKPRLLWIKHADERSDFGAHEDWDEPVASWQLASAGTALQYGPTSELLAELLGQSIPLIVPDEGTESGPDLATLLKSLYSPSVAQRHLNGAYFAAAVGMGQLAEEEFRCFKHELDDNQTDAELFPIILHRMGMFAEAQKTLAFVRRHFDTPTSLMRAQLYRATGSPFRALLELASELVFRRCSVSPEEALERRRECAEALLDIVETLQSSVIFRTRAIRRLLSGMFQLHWKPLLQISPKTVTIAQEGRIQLSRLREIALLQDLTEDFIREFWQLLDDLVAYPELYLDSGPVIPGYHLNMLSSCSEEDRLADLCYAQLGLARVLLCVIRRRWPRGARSRDPRALGDDTCVRVMEKYLNDADGLARALDESHLLVAVCRQRLKADKILGGGQYWRRQRLYLGASRANRNRGH